ncbi:MAG TPA: UDP-N-acetylmuramoyl-tripeptide--D-alanyl-D-alanine ligase [Steroidobacteraceae bacterium]|nr:UDP-N-acetylmuramoyl-tripeptide--D-alanyl-D-alanine ligase [Steroidobacteraceae bacterium]
MRRTLGEFARLAGGRLAGADRSFTNVVSDTRALKAGELFIALRGPNFDGNEFVAAAAAAGAAGALVEREQPVALAQIVVPDAQAALERAARAWRAQFSGALVGVAGSNGKTTAKEMLAAILSEAGPTLATRGNLNNHIGVPLTLLRLTGAERFAVVEMGANRPGEVAHLVDLARPTVGLITNAGAEHLEGFGSLEGVARAEGEMVAGLSASATAVINADDAYAAMWRGSTPARVVTFGVARSADFSASEVAAAVGSEGFTTSFRLTAPIGAAAIRLKLGGTHNVANALAAAASAASAGAGLEHIVAGLAKVRAVPGRLQFRRAAGGGWLIDDSYNANPSSVRAAIEVLAQLPGRRWLVLGDMAELGAGALEEHVQLGEFARAHGIERLYASGPLSARAAGAFGAGGESFADVPALAAALRAALGAGETSEVRVLVKGSRFNRLERVVEAVASDALPNTGGH